MIEVYYDKSPYYYDKSLMYKINNTMNYSDLIRRDPEFKRYMEYPENRYVKLFEIEK